jgi:hypothetical protein
LHAINRRASYLPHERDARTKGVPSLGAGAIYPVAEEDILVEPFEFPAWYRHAFALDVGWNRTAALWGAYSPEDDMLYVYAEYYRGHAEPAVHAAGIRARGEWIPGVIDPASRGRGQRDGEQLFGIYQQLGLTLVTANNAVEAGLLEVWQRLSTGRLKVFRTLQSFLGEYRIYRRSEKGAIVKENDHLMDCLRYLCMSGIGVAGVRPFEQLVVGFSGRENLATSGGGPGFSASTIQPGKVQLSGGTEWLEAKVGKRFPRNWGWRSLNNLSCRTFLSAAVARRRS